jgi:hypothetical protein
MKTWVGVYCWIVQPVCKTGVFGLRGFDSLSAHFEAMAQGAHWGCNPQRAGSIPARLSKPQWRNWQTRLSQEQVSFVTCGFDSHLRYVIPGSSIGQNA